MDPAQNAPPEDVVEVTGRIVLFGFDATEVVARVRPRPRGWRVRGALQIMGAFLVIAPVVAILPPHAPWPIGALAVGVLLARRRLSERYTLLALQGPCPKCAHPLAAKRSRLRRPHPLTCEACHHECRLDLPEGALPEPG